MIRSIPYMRGKRLLQKGGEVEAQDTGPVKLENKERKEKGVNRVHRKAISKTKKKKSKHKLIESKAERKSVFKVRHPEYHIRTIYDSRPPWR